MTAPQETSVIAGLDPAIQRLDARVKPGHDGSKVMVVTPYSSLMT